MICKACGKEISDYSVICPECGAETAPDKEIVRAESAPSPKKGGKKWIVAAAAAASVIILLVAIIIFISAAGVKTADLDYAPKAVGDTVFYTAGRNIARLNTVTGETMASDYLGDGLPAPFGIAGNRIYYVSEGALYSNNFQFTNKVKIADDVATATVYKNRVYFVSKEDPSKLKSCGMGGGAAALVTLLSDESDKVPADEMSSAGGAIYIRRGGKLVRYDVSKETLTTLYADPTPARDICFSHGGGAAVFTSGEGFNKIALLGSLSGEYGASVSAAAVWKHNVYGASASDGVITVGRVDLNNGTLSELCLVNAPGCSVKDLSADGNYIYLTASDGEGETARYVVMRINVKNGEADKIYSDIA